MGGGMKRFLRWLFAKPTPPEFAPIVRSGSGMNVTSRPCTPEEIEELVALKKKFYGVKE